MLFFDNTGVTYYITFCQRYFDCGFDYSAVQMKWDDIKTIIIILWFIKILKIIYGIKGL